MVWCFFGSPHLRAAAEAESEKPRLISEECVASIGRRNRIELRVCRTCERLQVCILTYAGIKFDVCRSVPFDYEARNFDSVELPVVRTLTGIMKTK